MRAARWRWPVAKRWVVEVMVKYRLELTVEADNDERAADLAEDIAYGVAPDRLTHDGHVFNLDEASVLDVTAEPIEAAANRG